MALWFISKIVSIMRYAATGEVLPLEVDNSSSIAFQSAIVFSFDKRRVISSWRAKAVAFCALMGTMLGMYRMSMDEDLGLGQQNDLR